MAALIAGSYLLVCTTFPALLVLEHGMQREIGAQVEAMEEPREGEGDAARVRRRRARPSGDSPPGDSPPGDSPPGDSPPGDWPRTSPKHRRSASHAPRLATLEEDHGGGEKDPRPRPSRPRRLHVLDTSSRSPRCLLEGLGRRG